ncbi:4'-phosphopantetheinyl transferase superfamily protein [Hahella sp. KA22]|uniref:4'-phosphopantetheinyl transferase family protein n=1 Tax=Hahella sp. KA22 TaxID=1628392 RepID=UPI000FDE85D0|nr:4'-phosphopantetheinyl transferase superfamily protein [Hahella sp. KA22]AZZ93770.1 4'-phosphopantetheinyl transferase superfamily protein [Hahella sp. KA22]QAY57144.1 4'-phosphopantetheinyl transferase superfamily protein [Hahella sp. KA22]
MSTSEHSECAIYLADIRQIDKDLDARYCAMLGSGEDERLSSFRFPEGRLSFLLGRALARTQLAERLGCEPAEIAIAISDKGKPFLSDRDAAWCFSIAHAGAWVAVAIALTPVGLDLERAERRNVKALARRFYTEKEYQWVCGQPEENQAQCFFRIWTLKEAEVKRRGSTMSELLSGAPFALLDDFAVAEFAEGAACGYGLFQWREEQLLGVALSEPRPMCFFEGLPGQGYVQVSPSLLAGSENWRHQ